MKKGLASLEHRDALGDKQLLLITAEGKHIPVGA